MKKRQKTEPKLKKNILANGWEIWVTEHFCAIMRSIKIGKHNFEKVYSSFIKQNKKEHVWIVEIC